MPATTPTEPPTTQTLPAAPLAVPELLLLGAVAPTPTQTPMPPLDVLLLKATADPDEAPAPAPTAALAFDCACFSCEAILAAPVPRTCGCVRVADAFLNVFVTETLGACCCASVGEAAAAVVVEVEVVPVTVTTSFFSFLFNRSAQAAGFFSAVGVAVAPLFFSRSSQDDTTLLPRLTGNGWVLLAVLAFAEAT